MTNKTGSITAVGLGPGDAGLLTIKGLKALKKADIILYPASTVSNGTVTSFSVKILDQLDLDAPVQPLHIPMNSKQREQFYLEAYQQIKAEYDAGKKVVVVSEGDILFYSTFGYLWAHIQKNGLNCELIPGIPAFIAASSQGVLPLVDGNSSIKVISCPDSLVELNGKISDNNTLVVMKLSKIKNWEGFFKNLTCPFLYAEKVGTEEQFITNNPNDLADRKIPYFALLIIYN